jgi:hypothetical protein
LEVFSRRDEIQNGRLVFFADRDAWVYSQLPDAYVSSSIVFTDGYSIENDAYRDGNFEQYLYASEKSAFSGDLERFVEWYALALERMLGGEESSISLNPHHVLGPQHSDLVSLKDGEEYPQQLKSIIVADHSRLIRGKSLLKLLLLQLGKSSRAARHSAEALMEVAVNGNGPLLQDAFTRIKAELGVG